MVSKKRDGEPSDKVAISMIVLVRDVGENEDKTTKM